VARHLDWLEVIWRQPVVAVVVGVTASFPTTTVLPQNIARSRTANRDASGEVGPLMKGVMLAECGPFSNGPRCVLLRRLARHLDWLEVIWRQPVVAVVVAGDGGPFATGSCQGPDSGGRYLATAQHFRWPMTVRLAGRDRPLPGPRQSWSLHRHGAAQNGAAHHGPRPA
jgi:hypothetical protein